MTLEFFGHSTFLPQVRVQVAFVFVFSTAVIRAMIILYTCNTIRKENSVFSGEENGCGFSVMHCYELKGTGEETLAGIEDEKFLARKEKMV